MDRRGQHGLARQSCPRRRIDGWVRDDLCFFELLRRHSNRLARYRLPAIEDVGRHRRGRDGSVSIMNIVDIGDVRDVGNVRYVSDVRDIHLA
jgi:hypothetical protein